MKIDSHQHFWKYNPNTHSWISDEMAEIRKDFTPNDLQPLLRKNGFSGCVAVQADQSEAETEILLKYAGQHDFIKGVVGWVDLASENVEDRLKYFSESLILKGIRYTVWDKKGEFMAAREFQRGLSALGKFDLTYDILVFDYQLGAAVDLVKAFPEQKFVLDHMAKPQISVEGPSEEWKNNIRALGEHENVYCKLSGLVTETSGFNWEFKDFQPYLRVVEKAFGEDRLMFGSDWPVCLSAASYEDTIEVVESYFFSSDGKILEKIFGRNAVEFYGLDR